ncbi:response regulator [Mucilaginibacter arboris]|uniref:Response regulator n=1 Tax=Mucilaginibacter arboris TaxID=2682090 RepID=A0A7K1SXL7_9SPHI|nr:response regulator [Mucilaginibacter arboris]MVN22064.1 response regulator [Mucilaginibacter arboris]
MNTTMAKKVLIFDDDEDILAICTYILEEQGWEVSTFSNCNNIIEKVESIMPDVILMDNWIPDSGGIIATQTIKQQEHLKNIPVVYFSANNDIKTLAQQAGADSFLAKPFDLEELENIVSQVTVSLNKPDKA